MEKQPAKDSRVPECSRESETSMSPLLASQVVCNKTDSIVGFFWKNLKNCSFGHFHVVRVKEAVFCFSQGLRLMTTSRRGPQLGSWPLLVVVPVASGNHWWWSFTRPTLLVLYNSEQPGKLHWFSITGTNLRRKNKFKHVSVICEDLTDDQWSAKVTFTNLIYVLIGLINYMRVKGYLWISNVLPNSSWSYQHWQSLVIITLFVSCEET